MEFTNPFACSTTPFASIQAKTMTVMVVFLGLAALTIISLVLKSTTRQQEVKDKINPKSVTALHLAGLAVMLVVYLFGAADNLVVFTSGRYSSLSIGLFWTSFCLVFGLTHVTFELSAVPLEPSHSDGASGTTGSRKSSGGDSTPSTHATKTAQTWGAVFFSLAVAFEYIIGMSLAFTLTDLGSRGNLGLAFGFVILNTFLYLLREGLIGTNVLSCLFEWRSWYPMETVLCAVGMCVGISGICMVFTRTDLYFESEVMLSILLLTMSAFVYWKVAIGA
jgi:hypothetical protein